MTCFFDKCDELMLILVWNGGSADAQAEGFFACNMDGFEQGILFQSFDRMGFLP